MNKELGRVVSDEQALVNEAPTGLHPSGFDPSRRFRLGAFATGHYSGKCIKCGAGFIGDKRALICLPCAADDAQFLLADQRKELAAYRLILEEAAGVIDHRTSEGWLAETNASLAALERLASAIEARRAATSGAVHESAGLQGDANPPPKDL